MEQADAWSVGANDPFRGIGFRFHALQAAGGLFQSFAQTGDFAVIRSGEFLAKIVGLFLELLLLLGDVRLLQLFTCFGGFRDQSFLRANAVLELRDHGISAAALFIRAARKEHKNDGDEQGDGYQRGNADFQPRSTENASRVIFSVTAMA